jgi:hypothetical protein
MSSLSFFDMAVKAVCGFATAHPTATRDWRLHVMGGEAGTAADITLPISVAD